MNTMVTRSTTSRVTRPTTSAVTADGVSGGSPGYDVIVLLGQSNMVGRYGPIDGTLDATDERILQYKKSTETIALAADPLDHWDETANTVGLGLTFAKQYLATIGSQRTVLLVPAADGGTGFSTGEWIDGGAQNNYAISATDAALAAGDGVNRLIAFLWHQGERDAAYTESQYAAALDAFIARLRSGVTGAANTPFIVGEVKSTSSAYGAGVDAALTDTPDRVAYTAFVVTEDLTLGGDGLHFTAASCRTMGERYFTALATAKANAPAVPGAVVDLLGSAGDTQITLTWSAPAANRSAITDYLVEYKATASSTWLTFSDGTSATTGATVTGLTNGTQYDFRVAAVNGVGTGAYSNTAQATPAVSASGFLDTFTDTEGTALASHTPDEDGSGLGWTVSRGAITIQSNAAKATTAEAVAYVETSEADGLLTCKVLNNNSSQTNGPVFRYQDADNFLCILCRSVSPIVRLFERVGGTFTSLAEYNPPGFTSGDTIDLGISYSGDSINVEINGVSAAISVTETSFQTETKIGVRFGATNASIDDMQFDAVVLP